MMLWKWAKILLHSWYSVGFCWTACLQLFALSQRWQEKMSWALHGWRWWGCRRQGKVRASRKENTQMAGRELKGQRRATRSKSAVVQRSGALLHGRRVSPDRELAAGTASRFSPPLAPSSWAPLPRVAFTQLQLMHMQSAATYAADR